MTHLLAQAEPAFLMSVVKPIVTLLLAAGWGWVVMKLDKDAAYFYLARSLWNGGLLAVGAVAFFLLLAIPFFLIGVVIWLILVAGSFAGYVFYRNQKVPPDRKWSFDVESFRRRVEDMQQASAHNRAAVRLYGPKGGAIEVPAPRDEGYEGYRSLDEMLFQALEKGAQHIALVVDAKTAKCRFRIDGVNYPGPELDAPTALKVVDFAKSIAGLDVSDRRKKQTGKLKAEADEFGIHTLDLAAAGSTRGITLNLDVDADRKHDFTFDQLGLLAAQKQQLDKAIEDKGRVVLVSVPPGQGGSTTLYRLVERHDPYVQGVTTLEFDHSLDLEGVSVNKLDRGAAAQRLHENIAAKLRADPDVVMLDFEPAAKTCQLIAQSAEDIRFYLDFDQPTPLAALQRWIKLCDNRKLAGSALAAVLTQRLLRKLCPTCRVAFKPDPDRLKKIGLPADKVAKLYRASGKVEVKGKPQPCPDCHGLGYRGRVGVFEVMPFDHQARTYVAAGEFDHLKGHLRKQKMMYLQEAALAKVVEGVTDIKEVTRVLEGGGNGKPAKPATGSKPPAEAATQPASESSSQSSSQSSSKAGA